MNKNHLVSYSIMIALGLIIVFSISGFRQISAGTQNDQELPALASIAARAIPITQAQSTPSVTIISPVPNQQFGLGQPITVVSNSSDPLGIVRVSLVANGQVVASQQNPQPQPNQVFTVSQSWLPEIPGNQVLQVLAYNPAGVVGPSNLLYVQLVTTTPEPPPTLTPTPIPVATPTPPPTVTFSPYPYVVVTSVDGLPVRRGPSTTYDQIGTLLRRKPASILGRADVGAGNWWQIDYPPGPSGPGWIPDNPDFAAAYNTENVPNVGPPPTPIPTPVPTSVSGPDVQPIQIDFWVDRTSIQKGECVTFYWNVSGVQAVYFEGEGVPGENQSRRECPDKSKTYALRVTNVDQTVDTRYISIEVKDTGTGHDTTEVRREAGIDFDNDARDTGDGNDFRWYWNGDRPVFEKWNDNSNLRLVRVEDGGSNELDRLDQDTCRWYLDRYDQRAVTVSNRNILCFVTNEQNVGKFRVESINRDTMIMQWYLWD